MSSVVFIGDSITAYWPLSDYFTDAVNKGAPGESPAQVLARFQQDAIESGCSIVHILVGTNVPYPYAVPDIITAARMARKAGMHVLVGMIPPRAWDISAFNIELANQAAEFSFITVPYFDAMVLPNGQQNADLFVPEPDLTHPVEAGYDVMAGVLQPILCRTRASLSTTARHISTMLSEG